MKHFLLGKFIRGEGLIPMCVNFKNFYHGVHGVSRRKKVFSFQNSVVLRDLRGYILLGLIPMCVNFKNFYHGVHGVSRRKKVFSFQNSVVLRDLRGYILLKLKYFIRYRKNIISLFLGILFVLYFIIISSKSGRVDGFFKAMIFLGSLWIIISVKIHKVTLLLKRMPKIVKVISKIILVLFAVSFIIIEGNIIYNMRTTPKEEADYVIILGCQVVGIYASLPMMQRVFTALNYLKKNPNTMIVITGGQGPGENISEAEAMKRLLLDRGMDKSRIFAETNAVNTTENFILSNELYNLLDKRILVVTSDYHMYRALKIAKKLKYKNVNGLPGRSQLTVLPANLLREYFAVVYYKLTGRI